MSEPHAHTDESMVAAVRSELGRAASRARNATVRSANAAPKSDVTSTNRVIVTRLRDAHDVLFRRLVAARRRIECALKTDAPYERTIWLRAPRGRFPFRDPRLGR
jgi:hypothetical protein